MSSDQLQISHLASGGRCLGGGTSRSARADIYKPVFPHRPEHSAPKRYREVLRIMRSLQPLCGMSQTAFDCRELLILRWTTPPQSHAAVAAPFIPQESRHTYMSPGAGESLIPTAVKPAAAAVNGYSTPPESPATPLASLYQERTSHSNDNNNIAGSSTNGGATKPPTVPSSSNNNNNNSSRALRKRISLAEVDRGFREAPFLAPQCTTNLSSICIRAFNTVKFFLGRSDREREDERLDVIEFHMVLSFVLSYLEALVLLDQESPIYEEMYDQQDTDHHIDNDVMLLSEALELLPLGSCANYPAGDASSAEAVARSLLQPSSSSWVVISGGGLVNRSSVSTFVVVQPFYENSCLPRLVAPADRFPRLRLKFPSQLVWNRVEDVPAAFRKDMLTPSTVLFPDLARVQALMNPTPSSSSGANANSKLLTNSGISPQRGSWSGGITATSGSFRLNQSTSFGSHHAATIMMQAEEGAAAASGGSSDVSSVASPELCEFLARAKLVSCFVEVVPNLSALTRSAI